MNTDDDDGQIHPFDDSSPESQTNAKQARAKRSKALAALRKLLPRGGTKTTRKTVSYNEEQKSESSGEEIKIAPSASEDSGEIKTEVIV